VKARYESTEGGRVGYYQSDSGEKFYYKPGNEAQRREAKQKALNSTPSPPKKKESKNAFAHFRSRKFIIAVILTVLSTAFLLLGVIDENTWSELIIWIFGTFAVGNAAEHFARRKS